jgi:hypothetical protein
MKNLIISTCLFLGSCITKNPPVKERLSIVYTNGDMDTIQFTRDNLSSNGVYLWNSCIYTRLEITSKQTIYSESIVCGVRSYKRL